MKVDKFDLVISMKPPIDCTGEQLKEWIDFQLGASSSMDSKNPLVSLDLSDMMKFKADEFLEYNISYEEINK